MIDLLLTILYAGLLLLAIVIVYGLIAITVMCIRSGLAVAERQRQIHNANIVDNVVRDLRGK